jgi:hypothetical protein
MIKHLTLVLLVFSFTTLFAQKEDVYSFYKGKFPEDPAVFVERSQVMNIAVEGDSLKIYSDNLEDILHLKEHTDGFASNRLYGSFFNQVKDIKAKTLVWEKNRYKELPVSDFTKNSDRGEGVFYDDSYYYSFNFPSVASGNRTQLQYRENLENPKFMSGFVFSSYLPQGKTSFSIRTTKEVDLMFKVLNDPKSQIVFKKTEKGNNVTYEWTALNLVAYRSEDKSPALRYTAPHIVCYVKSYQTKNGKVKVLSDLNDLYAWYNTFVRHLNKNQSDELKAIVQDLKKQSKTELDLVRNIFYWVQTNIHYIAFEQGMRGLIPHDGSYICEKRYGDCKDMANLLVNMLSIAEVKAYHTWIGTRDLPYKYSEFPTPIVDNHMIATYISGDGRYYFLDATSDHTPFGFPSSMIQGKEALIGMDETKYTIKVVPVVEMKENLMTDSIKVKFADNSLSGKGLKRLSGYPKVFGAYQLDRSTKDDVKKYVTKLVGIGNNKFMLNDYMLQNLEERDRPTIIDYSFRISDYHQKIGDEIFINLNLTKDYYNEFINLELRKRPLETEYQYVQHQTVELEIPEGYSIQYIPDNFSYKNEKFGCHLSYSKKGDKVILDKEFYINYLILTPEDFASWNEAVKSFSNAYKESVIISKSK